MAKTRSTARKRLIAGFLASLPDELAALVALGEDVEDEDEWESVAYTLTRIGETAASLELSEISERALEAAERVGKIPVDAAMLDLFKAIRSASPVGPFAPIAFIGDDRQVASLAQQDDGTCEPLILHTQVDDFLKQVVEWPQAVAIPASAASRVSEVRRALACPVYVYGPARDKAARAEAARVKSTGYLAEPVVLTEFLTAVRYRNSLPKRPLEIALLGPKSWSAPQLAKLADSGAHPTAFTDVHRVGSVLHSLYPDVVVLGPGPHDLRAQVVRMIRGHVGRSHVVILAAGPPVDLRVDAFVGERNLAKVAQDCLDRHNDHHRDRDMLTQLPNRASILVSAQRALAWSERHGDAVSIGLVRAHELDRTAMEHGMEAANACRRHLAISLERGLRRLDEVGYLGEDLFLAVLYNTRADQVSSRLTQLCEHFRARAQADRRLQNVRLSTSVVDSTAGVRGLLPRAFRTLGS